MKKIRKMKAVAVSTFLILGLSAAAALAEKPDWRAQWIGATTNNAENTWSVFRKYFALSAVPKTAVARIAVDSKYWLWINGRQTRPAHSNCQFQGIDHRDVRRGGDVLESA